MNERKILDTEELMVDYAEMTSFDFGSLDYQETRELQRLTEHSNKPFAMKYGNFNVLDLMYSMFTKKAEG
jgi:hypothetical protein